VGLKVSIDTNIFLSVKSKEDPYYKHSKKILQLIDQGELEGVVSDHQRARAMLQRQLVGVLFFFVGGTELLGK